MRVSTHSRPKAAGDVAENAKKLGIVSTHSRPKAAGENPGFKIPTVKVFQHTAARRRLVWSDFWVLLVFPFQHTAARRRLDRKVRQLKRSISFNTQPPEGGWQAYLYCAYLHTCFNTQPPEGGWLLSVYAYKCRLRFQHTAARRRLEQLSNREDRHLTVSTHSRPKAAGAVYRHEYLLLDGFNTQPPEGGWLY